MGSGNSSTQSVEEKALIVSKLKAFYEQHKDTVDDKQLQLLLHEEYTKLVESFCAAAEAAAQVAAATSSSTNSITTTAAAVATTTGAKTNPASLLVKKNSKLTGRSTRRRSFDQMPVKKLPTPMPKLVSSSSIGHLAVDDPTTATVTATTDADVNNPPKEVIQNFESATALSPVGHEPPVDSWDSVSEQPYCDLCKMAFKSAAFYDRHCKFSSFHQDNVKLQEQSKEQALHPKVEIVVPKPMPLQQEGTHFRLLYSGNKLFWRIQLNVDIDIFHHFVAQCIEVVIFNSEQNRELSRIYLDYDDIMSLVQHTVQAAVESKIKEISVDRFAEPPNLNALKDEIAIQKMATFILQRLHLETIDGNCTFSALSGDDESRFPLLEEPPTVLIPITVTRRRRSTVEEFVSTMDSMNREYHEIDADLQTVAELRRKDQDVMVEAGIAHLLSPVKTNHNNQMVPSSPTANAMDYDYSARIANIVFLAASILATPKWYHNPTLPNQSKLRFIAAVKKVIFRSSVLKMRQLLEDRKVSKVYKSPFKKIRAAK
jgi:hypothetical protein